MSKNRIRTAKLDPDRAVLDITWGDGHRSEYPLKYLRTSCPCATCRQEREEARQNPFRMIPAGPRPESLKVSHIEGVGQYGLKFVWNDGHSTGIYTLEHLRELCPCDACAAQRTEDVKPYVHGIYIPG
jgi:DUF971 family protein